MRILGLISLTALAGTSMADTPLITDFTDRSADLGWYVVNDNVMGGRSQGGFVIEDGELFFSGSTNTRGGGFSSIRTAELALDLSDQSGIQLKVFGDGRRYTWRLSTDARVYGRPIAYWAEFDTIASEWQTIDVPFSSFIPQFRGARLEGPPLDTSRITGMGLMIYDKQDGAFELRLASVHGYDAGPAFSLDALRWKKRVLVIAAPTADDPQLKKQLEAIGPAPEDFTDRDLALVVLVDEGQSTVDGQPIVAEDASRIREALRISAGNFMVKLIGKDGGVKLSSAEPVDVTDLYGLIDSMPMRRREMENP